MTCEFATIRSVQSGFTLIESPGSSLPTMVGHSASAGPRGNPQLSGLSGPGGENLLGGLQPNRMCFTLFLSDLPEKTVGNRTHPLSQAGKETSGHIELFRSDPFAERRRQPQASHFADDPLRRRIAPLGSFALATPGCRQSENGLAGAARERSQRSLCAPVEYPA